MIPRAMWREGLELCLPQNARNYDRLCSQRKSSTHAKTNLTGRNLMSPFKKKFKMLEFLVLFHVTLLSLLLKALAEKYIYLFVDFCPNILGHLVANTL